MTNQAPSPEGDNSHEVLVPNSAKRRESTYPGDTCPGTFRLQVFSTSERFTPHAALGLYCAPLALAGFTLGAFPSLAAPSPCRGWFPSIQCVPHPRATAGVVTTRCQMRWPEDRCNLKHTPKKRGLSTSESVHDPQRASSPRTADTPLGLNAFEGM